MLRYIRYQTFRTTHEETPIMRKVTVLHSLFGVLLTVWLHQVYAETKETTPTEPLRLEYIPTEQKRALPCFSQEGVSPCLKRNSGFRFSRPQGKYPGLATMPLPYFYVGDKNSSFEAATLGQISAFYYRGTFW